MTALWNELFVQTLREHIPLLPAADEISPDIDLYDLGLDSMRSVELLLALEEALDITIPDDVLMADTFRTPGNIWKLVQSVDADQQLGSRES